MDHKLYSSSLFLALASMYPKSSMPKSWIPKSDFVRTPFRFFLNCFNASKRDPCQSHGSQNQMLFVFHFVFFLSCSMHPRELHAKVMDPKIRFCSYSISCFFLDSLDLSKELHAKVMDPKFRFCSHPISFFSWIASMYPRSSMPK